MINTDLDVKEGSEIVHGWIHRVGESSGKLNNEFADLTCSSRVSCHIVASSYQLTDVQTVLKCMRAMDPIYLPKQVSNNA